MQFDTLTYDELCDENEVPIKEKANSIHSIVVMLH